MPRLFYDTPTGEKSTIPRMGFEMKDSKSSPSLQYLEKVSKLVPSEIIAGYITLVGLVPLIRLEEIRPWVYMLIFFLCLCLTPLYLNLQSEKGKPKLNHLIVSTVAFIVWTYTISGNLIIPKYHDPAIASIILIVFSLVSGVIPLNR